jgi:hypothetical protein
MAVDPTSRFRLELLGLAVSIARLWLFMGRSEVLPHGVVSPESICRALRRADSPQCPEIFGGLATLS